MSSNISKKCDYIAKMMPIFSTTVLFVCVFSLRMLAEKPAVLLNHARDAYQDGRLHEAAELADRAVTEAKTAGIYTLTQMKLTRAVIYEAQKRWQYALKDYTDALETFPQSEEIYNRRGALHFKMGHIKKSIRDFDKSVSLNPELAPYHWRRGISYFYANQFDKCIEQFEIHRTVNSNDVENTFWHFLCKARQDGIEAARKALLRVTTDTRPPMMAIYRMIQEQVDPQNVLDVARRSAMSTVERDKALFYAHLYVGLYEEAIGKSEAAKLHITKAAHDFGFNHYMGDVARIHAERLQTGN